MEFMARFYDGVTADVTDVICRIEGSREAGMLAIVDLATRKVLARWPVTEVFPVHGRKRELKIGAIGQPSGARLWVVGPDMVRANDLLPALSHRRRGDSAKQWQIAGLATAALAMVIGVYLFGVPLLASRLVWLVPPHLEETLGDTAGDQMEASLGEGGNFRVCDTNPNSIANKAITRFGNAAIEGSGSPFSVHITVVDTDIPNAFALPGGRVYYFSALLDATETPDEFAGVLSHEIGHVVYRHGMQQLIETSGTGLLVGFILGDMTGASVAASLGSALVDSRFSRESESQADGYAALVAHRMAFKPAGLADLLERVAQDDDFSKALALLSTHPLTAERRAALDALVADQTGLEEPFSDAEWRAIKAMCGPPHKKKDDTKQPAINQDAPAEPTTSGDDKASDKT